MPIRVECTRCHEVTYFADNDAGLAVACLSCKTHLKVPIPAAAPKAVTPAVHPDEPPPLFLNTPKHLMVAPPATKPVAAEPHPHHAGKSRPVRPASAKSHWRLYSILMAILVVAGVAIFNKFYQDNAGSSQVRSDQPATQPTSKPIAGTSPVVAVVTPRPPATQPIVIAPPPPAKPPVLASVVPVSTTIIQPRTYTPRAAPVGFIGLERIDMTGRIQIDSYNATTGPYAKENAQANAAVLSNGPIQLNFEGQARAAIHAGPAYPIKPRKNLTITGPTDPLPAPLFAPSVMLDPASNDSNNGTLPKEYFTDGNFNLYGKHEATLAAGVYYVNDLIIDSPAILHLEGPVTLLVSGQVNIAGNIETHEVRPANLRIRLTSDKPVTIAHNNTLVSDLYAPQSAIQISGKGDIFGSVVGKTLTINGTRNLHFDESLLPR